MKAICYIFCVFVLLLFLNLLLLVYYYYYYHDVCLYMMCVFECGHMQCSTCTWKSKDDFEVSSLFPPWAPVRELRPSWLFGKHLDPLNHLAGHAVYFPVRPCLCLGDRIPTSPLKIKTQLWDASSLPFLFSYGCPCLLLRT